ncbi:MAG: hypothetical protein GKR93_18980 [Gammaproteobacteria bacterium]|nr:hypothetical protein [Gammaproteobacteria bacterium]
MKYFKSVILLFCLSTLLAPPASAVSIRSLLGLDDEESETEPEAAQADTNKAETAARPSTNNWGQSPANLTNTLDLNLVKRVFTNLDSGQRKALLADAVAFNKFARQEAGNIAVISAARANKLDSDPNIVFLMQRGAENVLREMYLNRLISEKLPADFPNEAQIKEYYEKNQPSFVITERLHVWQIFFPVNKDMDEKSITALRKQANKIADDIRKKKISFNDAAVKHSKHIQSSANGGYMGLIKSSDLKPDIKKTLLTLAEGKISQALTTDTGIHIVKRGAIVPERKISLDEGKAQIKQLIVNQVRGQLRTAVFEQAAKTYPVELSDNKIEEWRLRLKTNLESPGTK